MSSIKRQTEFDTYWRSLAELADTEEFRRFSASEFPASADAVGISRRRWLQLMGASLALVGVGGCRWERDEIVPFAARPAGRTPGQPEQFATAMDLAGSARGLLVTSVDGRPIKVEGNPNHPGSRGASDIWTQAAILELYDPDRGRPVTRKTGDKCLAQTWDEFSEFAAAHFVEQRKTQGAGFHILAEAHSSPTRAALRDELLQAFPQAQWHEYEPVSRDKERDGARLAFGQEMRTHVALNKAHIIVCFDDDLLGSHPASLAYARDFATGRDPVAESMNRLYAVESCLSMTGAVADHRMPLRSANIAAVVTWLERAVQSIADAGEAPASPGGLPESGTRFLKALAADLLKNRGQSVVTVGPRQPPEIHAAVHRINAALGNVEKTVTYTTDPEADRPSHRDAIRTLVDALNAGHVQTLVILGGNPVYDAPVDLSFSEALTKAPVRIHLSQYSNETSRQCTWQLPQTHFLESWSDARAYNGAYSVVQPLIEPLFGGKSTLEVLAILLGKMPFDSQAMIRKTFDQIVDGGDSESHWRQTLHDGVLAESEWPTVSVAAKGDPSPEHAGLEVENGQFEIVFLPDATVYDGRFANNGWLQELPDPMTRLTWGNAALLSPATAAVLGVDNEMRVRLTYQGRTLEVPAYVLPGQAFGSVAVSLGYGRTSAGHVGGSLADNVETVGTDAFRLRTSEAMQFGMELSVQPTGQTERLASTQDHFAIDRTGLEARGTRVGSLVRDATLQQYKQLDGHTSETHETAGNAEPGEQHPPLKSLWQEPPYSEADHRWGMAMDLSKCIGCGVCVVACQSENNVPVVGKEQVQRGREMHWIRVDRYFQGDPNDPRVAVQPVTCQQCELAPCEQVCPVAATVHSLEGLNDMVYNRCVGTRYCANNCPYKVRRFNYFNYHKEFQDPQFEPAKMAFNPEVTVRSRGVMEKCSYCVQRIQAVKIAAKNERRSIADGEIQTACQQVCPTQAIVFGDLADADSAVARAHKSARSYTLLTELNIKPRTAYLTRIRNPNPELEDATDDRVSSGPDVG